MLSRFAVSTAVARTLAKPPTCTVSAPRCMRLLMGRFACHAIVVALLCMIIAVMVTLLRLVHGAYFTCSRCPFVAESFMELVEQKQQPLKFHDVVKAPDSDRA